jgi:hypothetical protein
MDEKFYILQKNSSQEYTLVMIRSGKIEQILGDFNFQEAFFSIDKNSKLEIGRDYTFLGIDSNQARDIIRDSERSSCLGCGFLKRYTEPEDQEELG